MNRIDSSRLLDLLEDPSALEALYREAPRAFRGALTEALELRPDAIVLRVWTARLAEPRTERTGLALGPAIAIALSCGLLVRLPALWLDPEWYYPRFGPSLVMLALAVWRNALWATSAFD